MGRKDICDARNHHGDDVIDTYQKAVVMMASSLRYSILYDTYISIFSYARDGPLRLLLFHSGS
jgi:hypothetical protein